MRIAVTDRFAGWCVFLSAIVGIISGLSLALFFILGQPWGTINDSSSVGLAFLVLPLLVHFHRRHRGEFPGLSLSSLIIGFVAMGVAILLQTLLIFQVISFEQTAVVVPLTFGFFGAVLMFHNSLMLRAEELPGGLSILGMLAGAGYVLVIAGFILGGQEHYLTYIGAVLLLIGYPVWENMVWPTSSGTVIVGAGSK